MRYSERNEKFLRIKLLSLKTIAFIKYAANILLMNSDCSLETLWELIIYCCFFTKLVTIIQFVNLVSLLKQKFHILNSYLGYSESPTQQRPYNDLWETLLQAAGLRNEDKWKDDALQMEAIYQALNRQHYSNIIMRDNPNISTQNAWLHKEKIHCLPLRIIWDVLCDTSLSVNSMYGLQILLCVMSAFIKITANLSYTIVSKNGNIWSNSKVYGDFILTINCALMEFLQLF